MILAQPTLDETRRIEALRDYAILDTPPDQALDDLTALAAQICGVPIALISFVDEHRQWFKATFGLKWRRPPAMSPFARTQCISGICLSCRMPRKMNASPRIRWSRANRASASMRVRRSLPRKTSRWARCA